MRPHQAECPAAEKGAADAALKPRSRQPYGERGGEWARSRSAAAISTAALDDFEQGSRHARAIGLSRRPRPPPQARPTRPPQEGG
jgi:hypothetical protein